MSDTNNMPDDFVSWVVSGNSNIPAGTRWDSEIVQSHLLAWQVATERATAIERERCASVCEGRIYALDHAGKQYRREWSASQCAVAIRKGGAT